MNKRRNVKFWHSSYIWTKLTFRRVSLQKLSTIVFCHSTFFPIFATSWFRDMLKKISQISLSLACMILILHAIIPHHNHPDKPICINSLNHNDCHNHTHCCDFGQHDNHNHDYDKSHCIIDDYFAPKDNNEFQISLDSEC